MVPLTQHCPDFDMDRYSICYKAALPVEAAWPPELRWDVFISAFTSADRCQHVYRRVNAAEKIWLLFPEYGYAAAERPVESHFSSESFEESQFCDELFERFPLISEAERICIDITGFIRPHLMHLIMKLFKSGVSTVDAIYSEPRQYRQRENTKFSDGEVVEVRQVNGFEGLHGSETVGDVLVIGAGYDDALITSVAENKDHALKYQLFGFPPLRPDMYQENVLRAHMAAEAVGSSAYRVLAPANDPFKIATQLSRLVGERDASRSISNLYLSPLATKCQALAFALYYIHERIDTPTSIIYPFCRSYSRETSVGVSRVWRYCIELPS